MQYTMAMDRDQYELECEKIKKSRLSYLKFKQLQENAVLPTRAKAGDAGLDLTAATAYYDREADLHICGAGVAVQIPEGYVGLLVARSSVAKTGLVLVNGVGVIDSGYRGELQAKFRLVVTDLADSNIYRAGERFAQLLIVPCLQLEPTFVDELTETERGAGGFGSSGK